MSRTHRLNQLMQALRQSTPPVIAQTLAEETGVSLRTLYRDIDTLRSMGAIIDGSPGFGYTLTEDAALPPMMFDAEEIEALVLGLREVESIGDDALAKAARAAIGKIQARLPEAQARRLRHSVLAVARMRDRPQIAIDVQALRHATWEELTLHMTYVDANGSPSRRDIDPLSIVFFDNTSCLIAWCHLRQDFRAFRLDRIQSFAPNGASFRPRRIPMLREAIGKLRKS